MLELIRRYKAFFSIIFVIAVIGLVISSFGPMGSGAVTGGDTIAKVRGEEIPSRDLINLLNQEMQRMEETLSQQAQGQDPEFQKIMRQIMRSQINPRQMLDRLVYQNLIYSTAASLDIHASAPMIRDSIQSYTEFQRDGRFDPILYRQLVPRAALFENNIRKNIVNQTFYESFESGLRVTSPLEKEEHKWLHQKVIFETVSLRSDQIGDIKNPTTQQLEEFSKRTDSEARLRDYYNKNISQFRSEGQVRARHILIKEGTDKDIEKIALDIKESRISFEEAAKKFSDDPSNAPSGGDLGFFSHGMMVPEFEKAAFDLKTPNEISGVVTTSFGKHLIQLIEREEASERSLEDVKQEILPNVWKEDQKQLQLTSLVEKWSKLPKGPENKDLSPYKLSWQKQEAWSPLNPSLGSLGSVESELKDLLTLNSSKPFLTRALPRGDSYVFVRFVSSEAAPELESMSYQDNKVGQAYEHYFTSLKEELEKKKKIVIQENKVAQLQQAMEAQLQ